MYGMPAEDYPVRIMTDGADGVRDRETAGTDTRLWFATLTH